MASYHELRIGEVIDETHDTRSFVIDVPESLRAAFAYRAGQFLTFNVPYNGAALQRSYSLSSSPECDDKHKVTVKRVDDGRVSNWFNDEIAPGDHIEVTAPSGRFVLRDADCDLVLFAGGSGITPIISIIKTAMAKTSRRAHLVYANRDARSIIFADELSALATAHADRLTITHNLDDTSGFLTVDRVSDMLSFVIEADYYVCGPTPYMDVVEAALARRDVPRQHIFLERFVSAPDAAELEARADAAPTDGVVPVTLRILWDDKHHDVPYERGETVLAAAIRAGIEPPFSCEEGYCSSCQFQLISGQISMPYQDCLTDEEIADGAYLACQAYPTSESIEIDWDA